MSGSTYVFCVLRGRPGLELGECPLRDGTGPLRVVRATGTEVVAIAGTVTGFSSDADEADLRAHHQLVERVAAVRTTLPMQYGVVVRSDDDLRSYLAHEGGRLGALLDGLEGLDEFRVEARYDADGAVREVVRSSPRLARIVRSSQQPRGLAYPQQIAVGEQIAEAIRRWARREGARHGTTLAKLSARARPLPAGEDAVFRGAFLVQRDRRAEFEDAVATLTSRERERLHVRVQGPMAPWDFAREGRQPARRRAWAS